MDACSRARAAHRRFELDDRTFVEYLAQVATPEPVALRALAAEDLYLACACLRRDQRALAVFRDRYGPTIRVAIARILGSVDADEAEQGLMQTLLVGSETLPPRIGNYAGRAPLERWVGVAAHRMALRWQRDTRAEMRAREGAAAEPAPLGAEAPEHEYAKERYRADFEKALIEALEHLSERNRALLRLYVVNSVSVEKIGKMYGVSQSTASRWLASARNLLLEDIKAMLRERLRLSSSEVASLADLIASRLDLSMSALLRTQ